ncbi:MAG: anaerobic ribonucleoside-triphosphate reductase activating protein [Lachnospiraceae bacterium]|nr:anaerobic ribonucleoside-triphosphate reductase activating protein [Lachnospiraceae bacterium]
MKILGLNKTTLLDYPNRVACTIFLGGCNLRCPFCHNKDIVLSSNCIVEYSQDEIMAFLKKRKGILTGVCITGGEPTIHSELPDFITAIKQLGYKVKLDTNGSNPTMLAALITDKLIDYCAMDIKNCPEKYDISVSFPTAPIPAVYELTNIRQSVQILLSQPCTDENSFSYEFRTTLVKELHEETDIHAICEWIAGANAYYLQSYQESGGVFCKVFHAHDEDTLAHFEHLCQTYIPNTHLRGVS